jgi:hypothetical protein
VVTALKQFENHVKEKEEQEKQPKQVQYPPEWQARVTNIQQRFPQYSLARIVETLHAMNGHAGQAIQSLLKNGVNMETQEAQAPSNSAKAEKLKAAFQLWDADGNGYIDISEFTILITRMGMTEKEASFLFENADVNKDDRLEYAEFVDWLYTSASMPKEVKKASELPGPPAAPTEVQRAQAEQEFQSALAGQQEQWAKHGEVLQKKVEEKRSASDETKIVVQLKYLSGDLLELEVDPGSEVRTLKQAVAAQKGTSPLQYTIVEGSEILEDNHVVVASVGTTLSLSIVEVKKPSEPKPPEQNLPPHLVGELGVRYRQLEASGAHPGTLMRFRIEAADRARGHSPTREEREMDDAMCRSW